MSHKVDRITKKCKWCEKEFQILESQVKRGRGKYCSRKCQGAAKIEHLNLTRKPAQTNSGWFKVGEVAGHNNPKWVDPIEKICEYCNKRFTLKPWILRQPGNKGRFCSIECRGAHRREYESGPNSKFYVGGKHPYHGRNWPAIRQIVIATQNGCCADCSKYVGDSLPVHHIKPFRLFRNSADANRLDNLVGLCQSCHMKREHEKINQE